MPSQNSIREIVTNTILQSLAAGTPPWRCPWSSDNRCGSPKNISGRSYSGVNPILLTCSAMNHGFTSRYWATFNQWKAIGASVKSRPANVPAGRWGTTIVFSKECLKRKENAEEAEKYRILRSFVVFNSDQVEGEAADRFRASSPSASNECVPNHEDADALISNSGADIRYGGDSAFYQFDGDFIQVPHKNHFVDFKFYPTVFHEMTHWSERPNRLNWDRASLGYGMGELIAELASCFVCSELNIPISDSLNNHAAYLSHWIEQMKGDSRYIFRAASQASKATDFLLSFRPHSESEFEKEAELVA